MLKPGHSPLRPLPRLRPPCRCKSATSWWQWRRPCWDRSCSIPPWCSSRGRQAASDPQSPKTSWTTARPGLSVRKSSTWSKKGEENSGGKPHRTSRPGRPPLIGALLLEEHSHLHPKAQGQTLGFQCGGYFLWASSDTISRLNGCSLQHESLRELHCLCHAHLA